jgi:hypothetical protein
VESHTDVLNASVASEAELRHYSPRTSDQEILRYSLVYRASRVVRRLADLWSR